MLNKTSSHLCDSWYFPMSLLRDGSLILINMASMVVLAKLWDSLLTILKLSTFVKFCGESMFINEKGSSGVFLKSFIKGSCRFTNVLLTTLYFDTLLPVNHFMWMLLSLLLFPCWLFYGCWGYTFGCFLFLAC